MILNKSLLILTSISLLLGGIIFLALQKTIPVTIRSVVNYCQGLTRTVGINLPHNLELLVLMVIIAVIILAIIKAALILHCVATLKDKLVPKQIKSARLKRLIDSLNLKNKIVLVEDKKHFAFCLGYKNPRIYLSTSLVNILNIAELKVVLQHENHHLIKNDSFGILLSTLTQTLFPFFPLLSDFTQNYRLDQELEADQAALKTGADPGVMLSVLKKLLRQGNPVPAFVSSIGAIDSLEHRIKALTGNQSAIRRYNPLHFFISLTSIIFLLTIVIVPVQAIEIHGQNEDLVTVCIAKQNSSIQNSNSSYPASRITP